MTYLPYLFDIEHAKRGLLVTFHKYFYNFNIHN